MKSIERTWQGAQFRQMIERNRASRVRGQVQEKQYDKWLWILKYYKLIWEECKLHNVAFVISKEREREVDMMIVGEPNKKLVKEVNR